MTQMEMGQSAGALSRAAGLVADARTDFDGLAQRLSARLDGARGQWVGAGGTAFFALHAQWTSRQQQVVAALEGFETRLRATEADTMATDDQISAAFHRYTALLG